MTLGLIGATGRQGQRYLMEKNGGDSVRWCYSPSLDGASFQHCGVLRLDWLIDSCTRIIIATPTPTHYELTKRCLLAGKNVLVEKPLAETWEQCLELIELAEAQSVKLMVAHTHVHGERWRACAHAAKAMGLRMRVMIPYCSDEEQSSWRPHVVALHRSFATASNVAQEIGIKRIECEWWREGISLRWSAKSEDTEATTPMRHQLSRFLGNWTEDLRAIYKMVHGVTG